MAKYRLDVHGPNPWAAMPWRKDGTRYDGTRRNTYPAILRQMELAAWDAMRANSLLDRPIAQEVCDKAKRLVAVSLEGKPLRLGWMQKLDVAGWSFCIYREA